MDLIDFFGSEQTKNDSIEPKVNPEYISSTFQQIKIGADEEGIKTGKLLDQFFIVTSKLGAKRSEAQAIKYCTVKESPLPPWYTRLPMFCFPDDNPVASDHFFTFVLTDVNGKQQYGVILKDHLFFIHFKHKFLLLLIALQKNSKTRK